MCEQSKKSVNLAWKQIARVCVLQLPFLFYFLILSSFLEEPTAKLTSGTIVEFCGSFKDAADFNW